MNNQEKYDLVRSIGEECIQEEELCSLFDKVEQPIAYDGFEPSGRMHIGQGILRVINTNKMTRAGCKFRFWVADWFAQLNNKMDGNLEKIRTVGKYMIEIWKAVGMDLEHVEFLWASDEINARPAEYWGRVMEIARLNNVSRIKRCCTIMGRSEDGDNMSSAQIFYPCMQAADIFFLKAHICQLGMDQRKVNMLAREYCDMTKPKIRHKPIILSHHMIMGLKKDQEKMSKSDPDSAIFMEDSEADVNRKIKGAYCPEGDEDFDKNPVVDYIKHIVFGYYGYFEVFNKEGNLIKKYEDFENFEEDYKNKVLHPSVVKPSLAKAINSIIEPVRKHFQNNVEAKDLLEKVKSYKVTK